MTHHNKPRSSTVHGTAHGTGNPLDRATAESSAVLPALIPQAHGGALLRGGMRGNAGGPGRPPNELRARLRGSFERRIALLESLADNPAANPGDRLRAIEIMAKYSLGPVKELSGEVGLVQTEVLRQSWRLGNRTIVF